MKPLFVATLFFGLIVLAAMMFIAIGVPGNRIAPRPPVSSAPPPRGISANGVSLVSTSVDLPIDDQRYPDGPHADVINANCISCHSASMVLDQPPLSADQWIAEVAKMREVYKAPVAETDVPAIVAYLVGMNAMLQGADAEAHPPGKIAQPSVIDSGK